MIRPQVKVGYLEGAGNVRTYLGGALRDDFLVGPIVTRARAVCKRDGRARLHARPHPGISDK
jgi:hypothetical protein